MQAPPVRRSASPGYVKAPSLLALWVAGAGRANAVMPCTSPARPRRVRRHTLCRSLTARMSLVFACRLDGRAVCLASPSVRATRADLNSTAEERRICRVCRIGYTPFFRLSHAYVAQSDFSGRTSPSGLNGPWLGGTAAPCNKVT